MFTLYMKWDAGCDLAPADIQFILTPRDALEMASVFYELDYLCLLYTSDAADDLQPV